MQRDPPDDQAGGPGSRGQSIQPSGFLIGVTPDWRTTHASRNAAIWLGHQPDDLFGRPLQEVFDAQAIHTLRGRLQLLTDPDSIAAVFDMAVRAEGPAFDLTLHRSGASIVIEAEPSQPEEFEVVQLLQDMTKRLQRTEGIPALCREAVRRMRVMTGFDAVAIYRFDEHGTGEVVAQSARPGLVSDDDRPRVTDLLDTDGQTGGEGELHLVADVGADDVPVLSQPGAGALDLGMSMLRVPAEARREWLLRFGAGAGMSLPLWVGGRLWGVLVCLAREPRQIALRRRLAIDVFGRTLATTIASRESRSESAGERRAREVRERISRVLVNGESIGAAVIGSAERIASVLDFDGVGVWVEGDATLQGLTPDPDDFAGLVGDLVQTGGSDLHAMNPVAQLHEQHDRHHRPTGVLAVPISTVPGDYVVFFRRRAAWLESDLRFAEALRLSIMDAVRRSTAPENGRWSMKDRQEILIAELNHRIRNILGLIQGVVLQSRSSAATVEDYAAVIGQRIHALSRAHDQIIQTQWKPGSLRTLIESEASAYLAGRADRVRLAGRDVLLEPRAFSTLALVLHELMTNAAKYGALSGEAGRVDVTWDVAASGRLDIVWHEVGGPAVLPPTRRGFGSTIVERSIPYDLDGRSDVRYEPQGVEAHLTIPAIYVHLAPEPSLARPHTPRPPRAERSLKGSVLVVEDNMILALDVEEMLRQLGAERVEVAASVDDAMRRIDDAPLAFAVLDVQLGSQSSLPVATRLSELAIPFAFATGYGESLGAPSDLQAVPVLEKPFSREGLLDAYLRAIDRHAAT